MDTIWRFVLRIDDEQTLQMPMGAQILSVAKKDGELSLWARVQTNRTKEDRTILMRGTGHPYPTDPCRFLGTIVDTREIEGAGISKTFVWHLFEKE